MLSSKWENLSRCSTKLIHVCKKLSLALACRQSRYSLWIYNIHIFFNFGSGLCGSFSMLFRKAQASCGKKKILNNFCCSVLLFVWAWKVCLRYLKSYFKLERGVFFNRYMQLKSSFSDGKTSAVKSETGFDRKAIGN